MKGMSFDILVEIEDNLEKNRKARDELTLILDKGVRQADT
jgi:hypothetical protein